MIALLSTPLHAIRKLCYHRAHQNSKQGNQHAKTHDPRRCHTVLANGSGIGPEFQMDQWFRCPGNLDALDQLASHLHQPTAQVHRAERNIRHGIGRASEVQMIQLQISEISLYADDGTYVGVVHSALDNDGGYVIDLDVTCFSLENLKEVVKKFEQSLKLLEGKTK
jgi:hypothetical protein